MGSGRGTDRRFTIGDLMTLVAAGAVTMALQKLPIEEDVTVLDLLPAAFLAPPAGGWTAQIVAEVVCLVSLPGLLFLAPWTAAFLVLRLRRPRPPWRRLGRQPGAVALLLGTIGVLTAAPGTSLAVFAARRWEYTYFFGPLLGSSLVAALIVGGWVALAVGGRWRPEPTWLDRAGRLVGVSWIVFGIVSGAASVFLVFDTF